MNNCAARRKNSGISFPKVRRCLYSLKFEAGRLIPSWVSDNFADFTGRKIQDWYQQTPEGNCVEESDRSIVSDSLQDLARAKSCEPAIPHPPRGQHRPLGAR